MKPGNPIGVVAERMADETNMLDRLHASKSLAELRDLSMLVQIDWTDREAVKQAIDGALPHLLLALDDGRIRVEDHTIDALLMGLLLTNLQILLDGGFGRGVTRH